MAFKSPHVSLVSFSIEIDAQATIALGQIETDLLLMTRHPSYESAVSERLVR